MKMLIAEGDSISSKVLRMSEKGIWVETVPACAAC